MDEQRMKLILSAMGALTGSSLMYAAIKRKEAQMWRKEAFELYRTLKMADELITDIRFAEIIKEEGL